MLELATLKLIEALEDALFIGPPGLGKSHCAKARGQLAVGRPLQSPLSRSAPGVRRVRQPHGVLAVWCYGIATIEGADVDALAQTLYHETVGPYWPPERALVEPGYRTLPFPFAEIPAPPVARRDLAAVAAGSAACRDRRQARSGAAGSVLGG